MDCQFCQIVAGAISAEVVWEDAASVAFLDVRPVFPGHILLVPREHHETLADLPLPLIAPMFETARRIARAIEPALGADGSFVAINNRVSQSVPHLHIHIVPRRRKDGLKGFFWPRQSYRDAGHMADVAGAIRAALAPPDPNHVRS